MNYENYQNLKLAHVERNKAGEIVATQLLTDHLLNTALHAAEIGKEIDCYYISFLLGISHDVGKFKNSFQCRILGIHNKKVNHSSAGASYLWFRLQKLGDEIRNRELIEAARRREILFYVITAHHGLYDTIGQGQNIQGAFISRIDDRMKLKEDELALEAEMHPFVIEELEPAVNKVLGISFDELILRALAELKDVALEIETLVSDVNEENIKKRERKVYEGFLVRLLFSILKTADCFDSAQWSQENKIIPLSKKDLGNIFSEYHDLTENRAKKFAVDANSSLLNQMRTQLSELAQEQALKQDHGISQFGMPTGAGKTEAGLRYGVNNINKFKKGRLIYTAPFLSVVEQSAQSIKNVVKDEFVLEHHSNVINHEDENDLDETILDQKLYLPQAYVTDYWDAAIIVTTMVQFYNTLFAGKSANICRFCKLIDSTIILDEIQSLPVDHIYCFNLMLNFLSRIMRSNILLCSATQPPFDHRDLDYPMRFSNEKQVIPPNEQLGEYAINYHVFERSKVFPAWVQTENSEDMEMDDVLDLIDEQMKWANSAMCILNTKVAVKALYEKIKYQFPETKIVYLTTNLCAAHRLDCIKDMRQELQLFREKSTETQKKLICVTTSLIEAGVDVDFDVVLRSVTGADSIEQARGRCNREGLLKEGGKVFILRLKEDNTDVKGLKDIFARGLITTAFVNKQVQEKSESLNMQQLTDDFYQKYFLKHTDKMGCTLKHLKPPTTALELIGLNETMLNTAKSYKGQENFESKHLLFQSFKTAAQEMKLIDQQTKSVIVPYKNEKILEKLVNAIDIRDFVVVKKLLTKLQRYTVEVPVWVELDTKCSFIYKEFGLGIYILQIENYDEVTGVQIRDTSMEALQY